MFDQNVYAQLNAIDPNAAAQYLIAATQAAAAPAPAPVPAPAPPVFQQGVPHAQGIQQGFQQAAAVPPQIAARGTLEDFFNQPTGGGGPSVTSKFFNQNNRPQGSWLQMTVLADVTNADVQHQKTPQGVLQYFKKNGQDDLTRPKLVLVVKVQVTGSSDGSHTQVFPDGIASLWLKKGPVTDNLVRAMTAAGDPSGYPKAGAQMIMISAGEQASRTVGFNATKLYDFQYAMPAGSVDPTAAISVPAPAPASLVAAPAVTSVMQMAPVPPAAPTVSAPPAAAAPVLAPTTTAPSLTTPTAPAAAPIPEVAFTPPPPPAPAMSDEKAALLAKLQGIS